MTIYQNTFDGWTTYHTSFKAAANDLVRDDEEIFSAYISTTRLDECGSKVIALDLTDATHKAAQDIINDDLREGRYDHEHNDSLRQPSEIFNLAVNLMRDVS